MMTTPRLLVALALIVIPTWAQSAPEGSDLLIVKSGRELWGKLVLPDPDRGTSDFVIIDPELGAVGLDRSRIRTWELAGAVPSILSPMAPPSENPVPKSWVRYESSAADGEGAIPPGLQTATTRYYHAESDTTLFLVGVVHIGDKAYFTRVQNLLERMNVVLFEGVGGGKITDSAERESMDALFKLQLALKDMLGLSFQKDAMNYQRRGWKNADVEWTKLRAVMKEKKVGLPTDNKLYRWLMKLVLGFMNPEEAKANPAIQRQLKQQVGRMLGMADTLMKRMGKLGDALITYRNEVAMESVAAELKTGAPGRWIALFYGAAHLPDFATRLAASGWKPQGTLWFNAWDLTP